MAIIPSHMKSKFLRNFTSYDNFSRGFLKEFFIKVPIRMFPRLVKLFHANHKFEDLTLTTLVKGVEVVCTRMILKNCLSYPTLIRPTHMMDLMDQPNSVTMLFLFMLVTWFLQDII